MKGKPDLELTLLLPLLASLLLAFSPTWAADDPAALFQQGLEAYVKGDYNTALRYWRPLAEQGFAGAQNNLGAMYENGRGVPKDYKEAVAWYRKAAEQGLADAQYNLGMLYYNGQGVLQDYREAAAWFRKAAEQGNADAQNNLGVMYRYGQGVPKDKVLAYALYNLSAAGDPSEENNATGNRAILSEELTSAEIEAAQALTRELMRPGHFAQALEAWQKKRSAEAERAPRNDAPPMSAKRGAPAAQADDPFPPRPAKMPGRVSCSTRCVNAQCWRTYDDGRKVKFTAKQKWNPFENRFEWDAGPC